MRIGVVISYRGTMKMQSWIDDTDNEKDCISHWENCANEMVGFAKRNREHCQIEVFLFLRWGFWNEFKTLGNHLKLIHQNTWLSNEVYLVIDRRFGKELEYELEKASLDEWFAGIADFGFDDILQTDVENRIEYNEKTLEKLKRLVCISRERRGILTELLAHSGSWKYEVLWSFGRLKNFIGKIKNISISETDTSDAIIILEGNWKDCRGQTQDALDGISGEKLIAVCTTDVENGLKTYADDTKIQLLKFSGFFDIRYFLQLYYLLQANKFSNSGLGEVPFSMPITEISSVERGKIFGENTSASPKASLISSAFDPSNFGLYNNLLNPQASRSLFELFGGHNKNKFVLPIVTIDSLSEHLEEMPQDLLAWVHFGHGKRTGLQSFDRFVYPTEKWLQSFRGKGKNLRLAFFFSCESGNVARKFAESGVKIAIGFEAEVLMEDCMKLAKIIVPLVLSGKNDDAEIVATFEKRCELLGEDYVKKCKPCIFISK